ncbi:MAG: recombination mediator RecR [Chitinophagales bacterium]|nr:recombination mediator RecR [Chitinophagales bacterium]
MIFPKSFELLIQSFRKLPGVGQKSATRYALHLLRDQTNFEELILNLQQAKTQIQSCTVCHNISESELCQICINPNRNPAQICVVEDLKDLIAIESTNNFHGTYHILGGLISPIDRIGPDNLNFQTLVNRLTKIEQSELIMALSPSIEADTTIYYVAKLVQPYNTKLTMISRGISFGYELDFVDEVTLTKSIANRTPYNFENE